MKVEPIPGRLPPSRIRSSTIFLVLVVASLSGAVVAELTAQRSMPPGIGQPEVDGPAAQPLAFDIR